MGVPALDISLKWNHAACGFLCLASFPQLLFSVFMHSVTGTDTSFLFLAEQYFIVWLILTFGKTWISLVNLTFSSNLYPYFSAFSRLFWGPSVSSVKRSPRAPSLIPPKGCPRALTTVQKESSDDWHPSPLTACLRNSLIYHLIKGLCALTCVVGYLVFKVHLNFHT